MNVNNSKEALKEKLPFYIFIVAIFLILISPYFLSQGMFLDGVVYSTIARNLANGNGTIWDRHYTEILDPHFHSHPPLAMALQSVFYKLFGDHLFIDKLYSIFTFLLSAIVIVKIWKQLNNNKTWLPLLFWISIPLVTWAATNNVLENTLCIFINLSILFYLHYKTSTKKYFIVLCGLSLTMACLTKGPVALFPWTFPFLYWLVYRKNSFLSMILESLGIVFFTIAPILLMVMINDSVKASVTTYFHLQLGNSLNKFVTVDSRFSILWRLVQELIPTFILLVLFWLTLKVKKIQIAISKQDRKTALLFILFAFTGVLPFMVSLKQSGFYLIIALPFFAIGFSSLVYNNLTEVMTDNFFKSKSILVFKVFSFMLLLVGVISCFYFSDKINRDENKINDPKAIVEVLPEGITIDIPSNLFENWGLHSYFARYKNISLNPYKPYKSDYLVITEENKSDTILLKEYSLVNLKVKKYFLYKKRN